MIISVSSRRRCDILPVGWKDKDDKSVECNDEGVEYIEARVVGKAVSQVIQLASSDIEVMEPFLPYEPYGGTGSAFRRAVPHLNSKALPKNQVNVFDCGGMVICLSYSHKIVDAYSFANFVKDWAATARGGSGTHDDELKAAAVGKPCYIFSSIFHQQVSATMKKKILQSQISDQEEKDTAEVQIVPDGIKIMTRRFVFKDSSISKLKEKCIHVNTDNGSDHQVDKQEYNAAAANTINDVAGPVNDVNVVSDLKQVQYVAAFAINLRTRRIPPFPANISRNLNDGDNGKGFHDQRQYYLELVSKIKDSIKLIDNEHGKAMKSNFATSCNHMKMHQMLKESWCRFPIYEADFGWGKPSWASLSKNSFTKIVSCLWIQAQDGIEAWVCLKEEDMVEFERHKELLAFAS
ncbi:hypothetical protein MKW92_043316 [Papaver armeniacum]|nr:hypothetical protein MKW92_043316 [Papaver armeniacum]